MNPPRQKLIKTSKSSEQKPQQKKSEAKKDTSTVHHKTALGESRGSTLTLSRGERRKRLDERLRALHQRSIAIEEELRALDENRFYRTCIFGSARIQPDTEAYNNAFTLARFLSWEGIDILTGGGPGLMEAANKGAMLGREEKKTRNLSFGLTIQLEWEPEANKHLDVKRHHHRFSSRLDDFMRHANSVVITPGGIGTLLELYFTWQLIQTKHIGRMPIVLVDKAYWAPLLQWMQTDTLGRGLVNASDFEYVSLVETPEQAFEIISTHHKEFREKQRANAKALLK